MWPDFFDELINVQTYEKLSTKDEMLSWRPNNVFSSLLARGTKGSICLLFVNQTRVISRKHQAKTIISKRMKICWACIFDFGQDIHFRVELVE